MAILAVCRLAILKRMPAAPLTLLVEHRVREQMKVQVQRGGKMKTWGGSRTQMANILNSEKERLRRCFVTERKRQWEAREALNAINHKFAFVTRTPRGNITAFKIWTKACTGRERQLC